VLLQSTLLIPSLATFRKRAHKRLLSRVDASVDLQMGRSKERLIASLMGTDVGLRTLMMSTKVIDKIAFGCEFSVARLCLTTKDLVGLGLEEVSRLDGGIGEIFQRHGGNEVQ